jgi:hypothetical protein
MEKSFILRGVFQDNITGGLSKLTAGMGKVASAAKSVTASMAQMGSAVSRSMNQASAATANATRSMLAYGRAARAATGASVLSNRAMFMGRGTRVMRIPGNAGSIGSGMAMFAGMGGGMGGGGGRRPPRRPSRSFMERYWGQTQMGLAALGQKGYALGRGGPSTLATLGSAYAAYKAVAAYGDMEKKMAGVRRAIDSERNPFSKEQAKILGQRLEEIGIPLSMGGVDVAGIAEKLALGGITNPKTLELLTKTTAQGASIWEGVDSDMVGDNIAKMLSLYYKNEKDPDKLNSAARKFIATTDYFADTTPGVDAKGLVTAFERSMASGQAIGISPESQVAIAAGWLQNAEKSGERIGTRQRTGFMDMMRWVSGADSETGKKRDQLGAVIGGDKGTAVNAAMAKSPALGLAMFLAEMRKMDSKKASAAMAKIFGDERGGYLMPLVTGALDVIEKLAVTEEEVRKYALEEAANLEATAKAGRSGRKAREDAWNLRQKVKNADKAIAENRIEQQVGIALDTLNDSFRRLGLRIAKVAKALAAAIVAKPLTDAANWAEGQLGAPFEKTAVIPHPSLPKNRQMPSVYTGKIFMRPPHMGFGLPGLYDLPPAHELPVATGEETDSTYLRGDQFYGSRSRGGRRYPNRPLAKTPTSVKPFGLMSPSTPSTMPPSGFVPRGAPSSGPTAPPLNLPGPNPGDILKPSAPQLVPGPPVSVTVPFTASVAQSGNVEVSVKVTQQPGVMITGAGVMNGGGSQGDSGSGITAPPAAARSA